ncbi:MAG: DUF4258 domain-containing protein [Chloroflexaceae bacterium]|nr:DUF4258 domain-containing protein [Chloroflexaceae bacterium]
MVLQRTYHALHRQARRNLSDQDVHFVMQHGRWFRSAGVLHIFLGRRDIPNDRTIHKRFGRLEGTTLVVSEEGDSPVLVTAYRNRRGLKRIRSKDKYDRFE